MSASNWENVERIADELSAIAGVLKDLLRELRFQRRLRKERG